MAAKLLLEHRLPVPSNETWKHAHVYGLSQVVHPFQGIAKILTPTGRETFPDNAAQSADLPFKALQNRRAHSIAIYIQSP